MKLTFKTLSLLASSILFFSCSIKQVDYSQRTVTVNGSGSVTIEADTATIRLAVITGSKDVLDASNDNAKKMNAIQEALNEAGVKKENINSDGYTIYRDSKYNSKTGEYVQGDYKVTNTIKIVTNDTSKIGSIIDLCLKNGANSLSSISYSVTNSEIVEKQARTLAIQKAQESANLLAGTSGAQLGKILKITELSSAFPKNIAMRKSDGLKEAVAYSDMEPTPIANAKSTVTVTVEATYQLR